MRDDGFHKRLDSLRRWHLASNKLSGRLRRQTFADASASCIDNAHLTSSVFIPDGYHDHMDMSSNRDSHAHSCEYQSN